MKHTSHYSLAMLVHMALWGLALPAYAADTNNTSDATQKTDSTAAQNEDTLVVTAAKQTLQASGVSTITADEISKHPPHGMCRKLSAHNPA